MNHTLFRDIAADGLLGIGPKTSTALCMGALLTAFYAMGAVWLGVPFLGLPLGAWLLVGCVGGAHVLALKTRQTATAWEAASEDDQVDRDQPPVRYSEPADEVELRSRAKSPLQLAPGPFSRESLHLAATQLAEASTKHMTQARRNLDRFAEGLRSVRSGLKIGLDVPKRDFEALTHAHSDLTNVGGTRVEWVRADPGLLTDGNDDARRYDALLRRGPDGKLVLFVHHEAGEGANWANWCTAQSLGYPSVFPVRLACSRTDFGEMKLASPSDAKLIAALTLCAGVLSRVGNVAGNTGFGGVLSRNVSTLPDSALVLAGAMNILGDAMIAAPQMPGESSCAAQAAARLLSAYVVTVGRDLPAGDRAHLSRAALDILPSEAELSLRYGAALLAEGQTREGAATLVRAFRKLRMGSLSCDSDPLAFVLSEAEHGSSDRMTLGRICAGLALAWGTAPKTSFDYLRDDLIDDLKYAGWLAGREDDVNTLRQVMSELEHELFASAAPASAETKRPQAKRSVNRKRKAA